MWIRMANKNPSSTCPRQTRHGGCSHTQSCSVYQLRCVVSRRGSAFAAARTVAYTEGSRCNLLRSSANFSQRRDNATQPLRWTSPSPRCRRRAPSSACAVGSGGRPVSAEPCSASRLHSALAACHAAHTFFSSIFSSKTKGDKTKNIKKHKKKTSRFTCNAEKGLQFGSFWYAHWKQVRMLPSWKYQILLPWRNVRHFTQRWCGSLTWQFGHSILNYRISAR